jgi:hypothetical protein
MKALFWAAVLNGILAPPILIVIMLVSRNGKIMGIRTNGRLLNTLGRTTVVLMVQRRMGCMSWDWVRQLLLRSGYPPTESPGECRAW